MKRSIRWIVCFLTMMMTVGVLPMSAASAASTVDLVTASEDVKLLGRTTVSEKGIEPHSTGAGMAFYAECGGDITLTMTGKPTKFSSLYLAVFVDGEQHRVEFPCELNRRSTEELVIATDLEPGKHTIEIVRETEENYGTYLWESISLDGVISPMEERPLLIEFVGDSLTAGYASYPETEDRQGLSVEHPAYEAGVKTYAYLTAQALHADFQSVCASGYGVVRGYNNDGVTVPELYEYAGYYHNKGDDGKWSFARQADVVVINLGSNDAARGVSEEEMREGAKAFLQSVREHNPEASIVWMTGKSSAKYDDVLSAVVEELGGAEEKFHFVNLPEGSSGGAGHPNLDEHAETADALTQFLQESVIPAPAEDGTLATVLWVCGAVLLAVIVAVAFFVWKKKAAG